MGKAAPGPAFSLTLPRERSHQVVVEDQDWSGGCSLSDQPPVNKKKKGSLQDLQANRKKNYLLIKLVHKKMYFDCSSKQFQ